MFGFLRRPWFWIIIVLLVVGGGGFLFMQKKAAAAKAQVAAAKARPLASPYAAIANGKADVEGGIIAVAARRGGIVKEVLVQEGETVTNGQVLARQEDSDARLALQTSLASANQARAQIALSQV